MQVQRLFEIVYLLLERKKISAKELAEHFQVSTRTIYRDIDVLSLSGIPIFTVPGRHGGIAIDANYVLNKTALSKKEQQDILMALQSMKVPAYLNNETLLGKMQHFF